MNEENEEKKEEIVELNEEIKALVETNMNFVITKPVVFEGICHKCRDKKEG